MSERGIRRVARRRAEQEAGRRRRLGARLAAGAGAALGATVVFAPAAQAETFVVDSNADDTDGDLCDPGSDCTLREAVREANGGAADPDTIIFASSLSGEITIQNPDNPFVIEQELTIQGPGANVLAISGDDDTRVFYVDASLDGDAFDPVTISGLTLTEGYTSSAGGALYSADTTLSLSGMAFTDSEADSGGGIWSDDGKLFITDSLFAGNEAAYGWGGGLYLADTEGSTADDIEFQLTNSVFVDNTASIDGGGLDIDDPDGDAVVENSTFSGNRAAGGGGGIVVHNIDGDLTIRNSTVSGNSADENGGGLYFRYLYDDETTTIENSTIVDNVAGLEGDHGGGGIYLYEHLDNGGDDDPNGPVEISSTIVANNTADFGADLARGDFTDPFEIGFSLIEDASVGIDDRGLTETPAGSNITGVDPQLGPLANNGGPTQTHLPAATSPVIDAAIANGLATDQRGVPRTFDAVAVANSPGSDGTDIGAVEVQPGEGGLPGNAQCQGATVPEFKGTEGDDTLTGIGGPDFLRGLAGNDTANGAGGNDCVNGDAGADKVKGGPGKDVVKGGGGKDRASGGGGRDKVKGNAGKDRLKGGGKADKLSGGAGKDTLSGGGGKDRLKGGPGKDKLAGGGGKDRLNCGGGKDKVTAQPKDKVSASCEKVIEKG